MRFDPDGLSFGEKVKTYIFQYFAALLSIIHFEV